MHLVEQHVISRTDARFAAIDDAAFASKNLYNAALYEIRQAFILEGKYLPYEEMDKRMKQHEAYKALPAKVAQQVLRQLDKNWKSFFEAREAYKENPSKFLGRPKLAMRTSRRQRAGTSSFTPIKPLVEESTA